MTSLKDKIKSKIKSKQQPIEAIYSFDENALNLTLSQGKAQLTQIRVLYNWSDNYFAQKQLRLRCRWYNKTENHIQEIIGIQRQCYRPSLLDVGTIIRIQIQPQLQGIQYTGMPIVLETNPISLAEETEIQANAFLKAQTARFFAQAKEIKITGKTIEGSNEIMIRFKGSTFSVNRVQFGHQSDEVLKLKQINIDESYPQFIFNRINTRELTIQMTPDEYCIVLVANSKIRDTLCLLHKLLILRLSAQQTLLEPEKAQISGQLFKEDEQQVKQEARKHQKPERNDVNKQSVAGLLQVSNLKQEARRLEGENLQIKRENEEAKDRILQLSEKLQHEKERLSNLNKNYSVIQSQLNILKQNQNGNRQQFIYYRKQNQILIQQNESLNQRLTQKNVQFQSFQQIISKLQPQKGQQRLSYEQLQKCLMAQKDCYRDLRLKHEYMISQNQKMEQQLKESRELAEQLESQKKHVQKRYDSLIFQISSSPLSKQKMSQSSIQSLSGSRLNEEIELEKRHSNVSAFSRESQSLQKQILDLKRQVKELIQENNFLRSLTIKDKKPNSRTQLKFEVFEVKKLANRLVQALTEKQMAIDQLKGFNKQLNQRIQETKHSEQKKD